jgi:hypothetical protein
MSQDRALPLDTTPDAHAAQLEAYRRMEGRGRADVMFRLGEMTRRTTMAGIRRRHPEYDDVQVRLALARLLLGDDLVRRVWPGRELVSP